MKRTILGTLMILALPVVLPAQTSTASVAVSVDCSDGESLNRALSRGVNKHVPATVTVNGTCSEYVQVLGFENLTLRGLPGASIVEPSTGASNLLSSVLFIGASSSVTVSGFNIQAAGTSATWGVAIGHGSSDVRLLNSQVSGGEGIAIFENSQVLLSHVTGQNASYATLVIGDSSDVHVEHCLFQDTTGTSWHAGINLGASHITMFDDTIRNMQVGISAGQGSIVDVVAYTTYTPPGGPTDVLIDSPAGNNYYGVELSSGSSLNLVNAKLVLNQTGQPWGGNTGGILVSDGSTLEVSNAELAISGSYGQGVLVENNSHATLAGGSVTGSGHGGVVVVNASTLDVNPASGLTLIGGNGVDLFCDQSSMITGGANLAGVPSSQCKNVSAAEALLP